jgi:alpha-galactosidase
VLAWAKSQIDQLMRRYNLDYIKMDFNINLGDGGDPGPGGKDPLWSHYRNLISLWTYLREKYPHLVIENCSSGSLRMDVAIAAMTDTHWVSDEVSDYRNLAMNHAMTYVFPPEICNHWTCFPKPSPAMDWESAFRVTMMGQFGLSGSILEWTEEALGHAKIAIAQYKELRPLIRRAEVYHLTPQVNVENPDTFQAAQYFVRETGESLLFAFRSNDPASQFKVALRRIDPSKKYTLLNQEERRTVTGQYLSTGLELSLLATGSSALVRITPE